MPSKVGGAEVLGSEVRDVAGSVAVTATGAVDAAWVAAVAA